MGKTDFGEANINTTYKNIEGEIEIEIQTAVSHVSVYITEGGKLVFTDQESGEQWSPCINLRREDGSD